MDSRLEKYRVGSTHIVILRLTITASSCDTIEGMKTALDDMRDKLSSNPKYFRSVYNFTFNFAKSEPNQRSLRK
jgi:hypothetical protein